jgi:Crinkler effector protein N-terminal domain
MLRLNYLIHGESSSDIGYVDVDPSHSIYELKARIRSECPSLAQADTRRIVLVPLSIPIRGAEFKAQIAAVEPGDSFMLNSHLVKDHFQEVDRNNLHVVVFPPSPGTLYSPVVRFVRLTLDTVRNNQCVCSLITPVYPL